jgi:glycosyltransferase involved in cell wall biosynthesis
LEVVIVDNLSSDSPKETLENFPQEQLVFLSEPDRGIYDAMNKGIKLAKGRWVIFLGAGDELIMDSVNQMPLDNDQLMMVYGNVYLVQSQKIYDGEFDFLKMTEKNISHQAIFYHTRVFQKIGYFDVRYKITADYVFNLAIFSAMSHLIRYYPLTISNFLGMGLSDLVRDDAFHDHRFSIINKVALRNLSLKGVRQLIAFDLAHTKKYLKYKIGV